MTSKDLADLLFMYSNNKENEFSELLGTLYTNKTLQERIFISKMLYLGLKKLEDKERQNMKDTKLMLNIAKNIVKYRKRAGLSQEQLAKKINRTQQVVQNYEVGRHQPRAYLLKMIADVLEVDINEFFK